MKYAKIVCGAVHVPQNYPCSIELNGKIVSNPTDEQYLEAGYLPLQESEPETPEGKIAIATYKRNSKKTKIVQTWVYVDEPAEEPMPEMEE